MSAVVLFGLFRMLAVHLIRTTKYGWTGTLQHFPLLLRRSSQKNFPVTLSSIPFGSNFLSSHMVASLMRWFLMTRNANKNYALSVKNSKNLTFLRCRIPIVAIPSLDNLSRKHNFCLIVEWKYFVAVVIRRFQKLLQNLWIPFLN